jgi:uncharacterized protein
VFRTDVLGGVVIICSQAEILPADDSWDHQLYRRMKPRSGTANRQTGEVIAIPYYAWANREPGMMQVWLRTR